MALPKLTPEDKEFRKLFWEARKEHNRLGRGVSIDGTAYTAAVAFARRHEWKWAEHLIEASKLSFLGQTEQALKKLAECQVSVPEPQRSYVQFTLASTLHSKGEFDEAIKIAKRLVDDPNFDKPAYAWNGLGVSLRHKGESDQAVSAFKKALALDHDRSANVWNNLGVAFAVKGDLDQAIKAFRKALEDPNFDNQAEALANLGIAYAQAGRSDLAREALKKALATPDPSGSNHKRARHRLTLLESKLKVAALSADDRALAAKPILATEAESPEATLIRKVSEAGDTQYERYLTKPNSKRDGVLSILRGWSSAVTLLEGSERRWRGGGYFVKWRGCGIVIDPGFDFLRNFHDAGFHGREIAAVVISHNHPDHNDDLKPIDDLCYELYKRLSGKDGAGANPYMLLWDEDTKAATRFSAECPAHHHAPIVFSTGYPQPFDLLRHDAKLPVRVIPFKVNHSEDVPSAMGMVIELLDEQKKVAVRLGYTGDTAYFEDLSQHLANCDVLIAHISQPSIEELQDATKSKAAHLGYQGVIRLLKECKPKLALIGEFWAGFTDLRIDLVKGLRLQSECKDVLPTGLGMHLSLPNLDVECTECSKPTAHSQIRVAPPTDNFGDLAYLCPGCLLQ